MKRLAILLTALAIMAGLGSTSRAQGLVTTTPFQATSGVSSGAVAVTNTFQSVLSASATRRGCTLQNLGSNTMYVYIGAITAATTGAALQLSSKQAMNCASGPIVVTDQISVTGTSGDGFVVTRQ